LGFLDMKDRNFPPSRPPSQYHHPQNRTALFFRTPRRPPPRKRCESGIERLLGGFLWIFLRGGLSPGGMSQEDTFSGSRRPGLLVQLSSLSLEKISSFTKDLFDKAFFWEDPPNPPLKRPRPFLADAFWKPPPSFLPRGAESPPFPPPLFPRGGPNVKVGIEILSLSFPFL